MSAEVILGDCLEVMAGMEENSIDAVVTDPPYGLKFMGVAWDTFSDAKGRSGKDRSVAFDKVGGNHNPSDGVDRARTQKSEGRKFQAWAEEWSTEALRVLKPGAYLLAFGGTRTYHRLACAIEDAGFEVCDSLCWLYGSGFPKHKSKLKPAYEPIVMARKPAPRATLLNIDACRLTHNDDLSRYDRSATSAMGYHGVKAPVLTPSHASGRWPANVLLDEEAASALDEMSGIRIGRGRPEIGGAPRTQTAHIGQVSGLSRDGILMNYGDTGGASRFFYCAKSSRSEREAGLEIFPRRLVNTLNEYAANSEGRTARKAGGAPRANTHCTVKPVALMRWLVRLVTPPDGLVLDPFTGSGTTGIAAALEGRRFVGIEREAEYVEIARARIAHAQPSLGVA